MARASFAVMPCQCFGFVPYDHALLCMLLAFRIRVLLASMVQGTASADAGQASIILSINDPEANAAGLVR